VQTGDAVTENLSWVPAGVDPEKASIARVYDYWLGGSHNLRADREAAHAFTALEPNARAIARANRDFLRRAVRFLAAAGIRQFLDIGSGIPTVGNVHEIARAAALGSRVAYVDVDPVAVAHSRSILTGADDAAVFQADLREPGKILADPGVRTLIDFGRPVGLLLVAVLHCLSDADDPWQVVATLRDALPPGSFLVVSHASREGMPDRAVETLEKNYAGNVAAAQGGLRSRAEIERFFTGFEVVEPGVVRVPFWRQDAPEDTPSNPDRFWWLVGVGRKP
jgi:SAM-dependent methyltransferase